MNNTIMSISNVQKNLGRIHLGPLELDMQRGYVYAVVGPNGSGKSTLFRMILGLVHPDQGEIRLFPGESEASELELKRKMGYVPELSKLYDEKVRAGEWASFIAQWYPSWNQRLFDKMVQDFEVNLSLRLDKMSKGERRRFDLVMGLAHEPELLLLDEPSSGLDPLVWSKVMDYLNSFMSSGDRSILLATHVTEEVHRLADYVVFINKGQLLGMYEKDAMLDEWKMLWVEGEPTEKVVGALEVKVEGRLTRIMTRNLMNTEEYLSKKGFHVLRAESLQVEEILAYLIKQQ